MATVFERASAAGAHKAVNAATKAIPQNARKHLPLARQLLVNGPGGLINAGLDSVLLKYGVMGTASNMPEHTAAYFGPNDLLGGLTLKEAREIFQRSIATDYAKKNLFLVNITNLDGAAQDFDFNFFVTEISYPGATVAGEAVRVGAGSYDQVHASEPREVRLSTLDDRYGSLKRWFMERHDKTVAADGTVGLPVDYLFAVDIMHAYPAAFLANDNGFVDSYVMRVSSVEYDLSRRDDGLEEVQMTFSQWDTFANL